MKCSDCGQLIPPSRGYCISAPCHNKMVGGDRPEKMKPSKRWQNSDPKRCPFCSGEETGKSPCYISACDRGIGGKSCGCHYLLSGMGDPGFEAKLLRQEAESKRRLYHHARKVA